LEGTEQGLYLYYNFDIFALTIPNVISSTRNTGTLYPAATWNSAYEYEVLSLIPNNLSAIYNTVTCYRTGDSYEIEVSDKVSGNIIKADAIQVNSYSLSGLNLSSSLAYNIKVRTKKSLFYSD